ncbi:MAG TPA: hypothetical protein VNJ70_14455 [Thermoanaerobaculia bacterium]|nr:hypothetical protein [Thermoanaerobaculia bacterium]
MFGKLFRGNAERLKSVPEDQYLEVPPFGQVLVLDLATGSRTPPGQAVASRLMKFADAPTPFVAILIDFGDRDYRFSSADLGILGATIAAWHRGWVAPCAIVIRHSSADALQKLLDIIQFSQLRELRIVETRDFGMAHIREQLASHGA